MRIVVFDATGGTGREVVAQALDAGHQVTAVAHKPSIITIQHEGLKVLEGMCLNLKHYHELSQDRIL